MSEAEMVVENRFGIGRRVSGEYIFLLPVPRTISEDDALQLAAWIVAMHADDDKWQQMLERVRNT